MIRTRATRLLAVLTIAAVATIGLTACTGSPSASPTATVPADAPGDEGQSVADACALVKQTIDDATKEFESAAADDPAAVADAMVDAAGKLIDAAGKVTNDDVAALLPDLHDMFAQAAEVMRAIVAGDVSKVGDLASLGEQFQSTSARFQELCSG